MTALAESMLELRAYLARGATLAGIDRYQAPGYVRVDFCDGRSVELDIHRADPMLAETLLRLVAGRGPL